MAAAVTFPLKLPPATMAAPTVVGTVVPAVTLTTLAVVSLVSSLYHWATYEPLVPQLENSTLYVSEPNPFRVYVPLVAVVALA